MVHTSYTSFPSNHLRLQTVPWIPLGSNLLWNRINRGSWERHYKIRREEGIQFWWHRGQVTICHLVGAEKEEEKFVKIYNICYAQQKVQVSNIVQVAWDYTLYGIHTHCTNDAISLPTKSPTLNNKKQLTGTKYLSWKRKNITMVRNIRWLREDLNLSTALITTAGLNQGQISVSQQSYKYQK